ncbi:hypothetical protein QEJ31_13130 [Pigmentibacter sp. JX0631]|uniref:hypothetical protein n=1 Tax=Pigmentibacter sp. JX0631 TaxID=2976982 RepID=UPI0024691F21|nr:hypothetical protein [Pigmentibacter sp. JX0631]WGL59467.1 hypothetical protein QEJ31_13130 [Pigmentibacter sp. JX0631]
MKFKFNKHIRVLSAILAFSFFNCIYAIDYHESTSDRNSIPLRNYLISHKKWIKSYYQQEKNLLVNRKSYSSEPSQVYKPNFYERNELTPLFDRYSYVKDSIEKPVTIKNKELIQNVEFVMTPHFNLLGAHLYPSSSINVSLELKALFF